MDDDTREKLDIFEERLLAIENRNGLGSAANLTMTFDNNVRLIYLDPASRGELVAVASRYEQRNSRFDVTFEIANDRAPPTRLRFTGPAVETIEAAVVANFAAGVEVGKLGAAVVTPEEIVAAYDAHATEG